MSKPSRAKDYYDILGADEETSAREIDRLYKRKAALHHPDKGGSEDAMKSLNEAYGVLGDEIARKEYDAKRGQRETVASINPVAAPSARDVGMFGHFLSAFLCLFVGSFLLFLVRAQWIFFLWPLAILSVLVIIFGVLMLHSAVVAYNDLLSTRNPIRKHVVLREALFWTLVLITGCGVYVVLTAVE